ncbi:hypothetical protein GQ53DRAFT_538595 [Thozetella sp. PMI_491]|nr:hypothetical protein GQ53DRAFT_538595 [Thozetella sp. PMI_491]
MSQGKSKCRPARRLAWRICPLMNTTVRSTIHIVFFFSCLGVYIVEHITSSGLGGGRARRSPWPPFAVAPVGPLFSMK